MKIVRVDLFRIGWYHQYSLICEWDLASGKKRNGVSHSKSTHNTEAKVAYTRAVLNLVWFALPCHAPPIPPTTQRGSREKVVDHLASQLPWRCRPVLC